MRFRSFLVLVLCLSGHGASHASEILRDGDIIFQTSKSGQSVAIQRATDSAYSHMGLILYRGDKPFVFEASATARFTSLRSWIARGEGGHYVIKRLRAADSRFTPEVLDRMHKVVKQLSGKKYDLTFEWSDDRMYCSELVWKIYKSALDIEIGKLQKLRDFRLDDPAVQAKLRERYGAKIPLDEPVISPVAMFVSPELETVVGR